MPSSPDSPTSSSKIIPLPRGEACLQCRRRKLKCDAAKPACSKCSGAGRGAECEYQDTRFLNTIQSLEEQVTSLQGRIRSHAGPCGVPKQLIRRQQPRRQRTEVTVRGCLYIGGAISSFVWLPTSYGPGSKQCTQPNRLCIPTLDLPYPRAAARTSAPGRGTSPDRNVRTPRSSIRRRMSIRTIGPAATRRSTYIRAQLCRPRRSRPRTSRVEFARACPSPGAPRDVGVYERSHGGRASACGWGVACCAGNGAGLVATGR
ncbi:hypothetical protein EXIGLDRAFT_746669 [Exidia glandulosa HHB12029]|uniref:Zn(2)-C6 fungal-type domain-containing protein n=1 Tax=Exidia glandulosa HHB12029 TaxID=1314781 RepID=A0A165LU98_EXIGL|nr:hypothetical protein EXIGLDRAFT_746669 [Exidia glandulosa HHB12029]